MEYKVPLRKRVVFSENERITYEFPAHTKLHVKQGDDVTPETILAEYEVSWGFRIFHVGQALRLRSAAAKKSLQKQVGQRMYEGEVVAQTSSLLPFQKKQFKSPVDGILQSVTENGDITVSMLPQRVIQASLFWGNVEEVNQNQENDKKGLSTDSVKIIIKTQVAKLYGIMGSGKRREGRIVTVGAPSDFVLPQKMESSVENSIIVAGSLIEHGVLEKALLLKASGIIAGGIHLRDATAMGIKLPHDATEGTDVGITIVITEGFGPVSIGDVHYSLLSKYNGRYGIINGNTASLLIPLKLGEISKGQAKLEGEQASETIPLKTGMVVRILSQSEFGKIGVVKEIAKKPEMLASGLSELLISVELYEQETLLKPVGAEQLEAPQGAVNDEVIEAFLSSKEGAAVRKELVKVPITNIEAIR